MTKKRAISILKWFSGILAGLFLLITFLLYIFKDDICQMAISELNKHLKTKVSVSEVDLSFWSTFPNLSVDFNNVFVQDSYEGSDELDTLLYSDRMRFKFDPWELWEENYTIKSIDIEPGVFMMKVNEAGEINYDIIKPVSDSTGEEQVDLHLNEIVLHNFRFRYTNDESGQDHYTLIKEMKLSGNLNERIFTAQAESNLHILSSRSKNMTLVSDKEAKLNVSVKVNSDSSTVRIPRSVIYIEDLPFNFQGLVDSSSYDFDLDGNHILIQDAANKLALEETNDVKKFSGTGQLIFGLSIGGEIGTDKPAVVECNFGIENGSLREPETGVTLTKLNVDGSYSNKEGAEKEELVLNNISFNTKGGAFKGQLKISEFDAPLYKGNADGLINLAVLHSIVRLPYLESIKGTADLRTDFRVKSKPQENGITDFKIERLEGKLKMNGVDVRLIDDKRVFKNITGTTYLRNDEIGLKKVSLHLGGSDLLINGVFRSLGNYLSKRGPLDANVELTSKKIDLSDLSSDTKEEKIQQQRSFILPDNIGGNVYLYVADLIHEKHSFKGVSGNMVLNKRLIHFPRLGLRTGGADVTGSLTIEERRPEIFYISMQAISQNIEFKKLFNEWDNFHQNVISSENISGVAKANVTMEAPFDFRAGIIPNAIKSKISIKINDGRLKGVEAFKDITESMRTTGAVRLSLGKENIEEFGRKLNDLKFDEFSNTLIIENSVITIPAMSIKSSALDLETSGKHTFDNKIDYRFGFRLRDLKKKEESEFGEIVDDGSGMIIFMRMYGDLDNPNFEWDSESNRENRKKNIEEEKVEVKSILKSEFGLYKNDTTVKQYIPEKKEHETIEVITDPLDHIDTLFENKKPKRDTKLNRYLEKLKKEAEKEKEEEFIIDE